MKFEILSNLFPGVFHSLELYGKEGYFFLPSQYLAADSELYVSDFELTKSLQSCFTVGIVGSGSYVQSVDSSCGFLFHSKLPVNNYSTALLAFSKAWQQSSSGSFDPESVNMIFKNEFFIMYDAPSIATMVTCPELNDDLNSFLTMI